MLALLLALSFGVVPDPETRFPLPVGIVCYDGHLYERLSLSGDGGPPFARRPVLSLTAEQARSWKDCGGMTILGSFALLATTNALDMLTTSIAMNNEQVTEANNFIFGNPKKEPLRFAAIKAGVTAMELFIVHWVESRNPKLALRLRRMMTAINSGVSLNNIIVAATATVNPAVGNVLDSRRLGDLR